MKKFILFSVLFSVLNVCVAQEFDEDVLEGEWSVEAIEGTLPFGIQKFTGLQLGESYDEYEECGYDYPCSGFIKGVESVDATKYTGCYEGDNALLDYFICNSNKLHLIVGDHYTLHFTISSLTPQALIIKTANATVTLSKKLSAITQETQVLTNGNNDIYDLNGVKIPNIEKSGIYIIDGEKRLIQTGM